MIQYIKKAVLIVIAIIASIGIQLNINMDICIWNRFSGNYMISLILCFFIFEALEKVSKLKDKRVHFFAGIIALVFSVIEVLGFYLENYNQLHFVKVSIIKGIAYYICFYIAITILFSKIKKNANKAERVHREAKSQKNIKLFFGSWGVIFICWIPYFIKYFPGIMTPDSILQAGQAIAYGLNSHHPMFHTLIIKLALNIGNIIKDYNMGVAIYSIMQMLIMSSIFAYAITYIDSRQTSKVFSILSLVYFAIYPVFGVYSITMWKDILFGGVVLIYAIRIFELICNTEENINSIKSNIILATIILLISLLRNNGIYTIILSFPIMLIIFRKYWKKILAIYLIPIILYFVFNSYCFNVLNAGKGNIAEAFSIPMQQFARVVKYHKDELAEEDKNKINQYIPVADADSLYDARISDPIKNNFNSENFKQNKLEFFKLWLKLLKKYPKEYVEAFLYNSYGYWYPDTTYWIIATEITNNDFGITQSGIKNIILLDKLLEHRNIPIISMAYSIGFIFFIILFIIGYLIYIKEYKIIAIFIQILALWLTTLASPVYCEYRYMFSFFTCIPIMILTILGRKNNKKGKNSNGKNSSINTLL